MIEESSNDNVFEPETQDSYLYQEASCAGDMKRFPSLYFERDTFLKTRKTPWFFRELPY